MIYPPPSGQRSSPTILRKGYQSGILRLWDEKSFTRSPEKRIFCNFDGCHNKRSSGSRSPDDSLISDLLSPDKQDPDYVSVSDQSLEKILNDDTRFGSSWNGIPKRPSDDVVISPRLIGALIRRLGDLERGRRVQSTFDN
ncbi:hypothetical protein LSH36_274g05034 [Paralvinella palmiformis]|uniref:Uncharacterized protein n=1 Tax=Paralvinella palmiformis TaxID=53620 RepID=A0AAD9N2E9_9ANNE|nr:hypothetical protein LSH36_274g05034 [Paralvinella palmiformis]